MRTSREWIERTVAGLDPAEASTIAPEARHVSVRPGPQDSRALIFEITLSDEEVAALDAICLEDELTPKQALSHIVRARLLQRPQFGRGDRARLRACVELLRAMEQHVGRAAPANWWSSAPIFAGSAGRSATPCWEIWSSGGAGRRPDARGRVAWRCAILAGGGDAGAPEGAPHRYQNG